MKQLDSATGIGEESVKEMTYEMILGRYVEF